VTIPDLTVGDSERPWIDVAPYQVGDTAATLTLHSPADIDPAGTDVPLAGGVETVVDGVPVLRFRAAAAVQYPVPSWWVRSWDVTGVGACQPDERFFVAPNPTAGGPEWTPTRERVAAYIPERTVEVNRLSDGQPVLTFTADTRPSARQVDQQIEDAVAWVTTACGDLDTTLFDTARGLAAIRAAGMAEISWPVRDGDINAGQALLTQADNGLKALAARNESLTGVDPDDPDAVFEIAPLYSFPCAPSWGDGLLTP
jgi:hypothetical protein